MQKHHSVPTPHIEAQENEIAKIVLMPGDPLRAQYIAETFLTNVKVVNRVRNMLMFTGTYKNRTISICASGMGQPSISIYSYELFKFYGVEKIVRIGTAGSYQKDLPLYAVVLVTSAYTDSSQFGLNLLNRDQQVFEPANKLNDKIRQSAKELDIKLVEGRAHTSDVFYSDIPWQERQKSSEAICVEMESAALFATAQKLHKQAACLLTISDNFATNEVTSALERQTKFAQMMEIALELAE